MKLQPIVDLLRRGMDEGAFPCAAFAVGCGRTVYLSDVMGDRAVYPVREPADRATLFDMASLSKLMATTMAALRLIEDGKLLLADPLSRYFTAAELEGAPAGRRDGFSPDDAFVGADPAHRAVEKARRARREQGGARNPHLRAVLRAGGAGALFLHGVYPAQNDPGARDRGGAGRSGAAARL